jgi:B12-binding domain/radical SAM domain protein
VALAVRELPGSRNGLAYALAPVEGRVDIYVVESEAEVRRLEEKRGKALVLYGLTTPSFAEYWREVAEMARRHVVVVGGPHAMGDPITLIKLGVKYVVVGDGEAALPAIIERELHGEDIRPPNTLFVEGGVRAGPRVFVDLDRYKTYSEALAAYPPMEITRGCGFRCAFCQTWLHGPVRHRSVESVESLARRYVEAGERDIRFIAPVGFLYGSRDGRPNVDALVSLLTAVRRVGGRPYLGTFPSETRPETVTADVLRAIKPLVANRKISFGLQTASERLLRLSKRGHGVEAAFEAAEVARAHGFTPIVDVIAGMPGEGAEDVMDTIAAMERLVKLGAKIRLHYFIPLPGTPWWGRDPAPLHPAYVEFIAKHRAFVEGYWREQMELAKRIREAYREVEAYLSKPN